MGKKSFWDNIWNSVLIFALFESLLVPWGQLDGRLGASRAGSSGGGLAALDGTALQPDSGWQEWRSKRELARPWREAALERVVRALYPERGLDAFIFNDAVAQPVAPGGAVPSPRPPQAQCSGGNCAEPRQELSIEDYDLIDVLWRQDIDQEKGSTFPVPTPSQHEQDMLLLTEKHLRQQHPWSAGASSFVDGGFAGTGKYAPDPHWAEQKRSWLERDFGAFHDRPSTSAAAAAWKEGLEPDALEKQLGAFTDRNAYDQDWAFGKSPGLTEVEEAGSAASFLENFLKESECLEGACGTDSVQEEEDWRRFLADGSQSDEKLLNDVYLSEPSARRSQSDVDFPPPSSAHYDQVPTELDLGVEEEPLEPLFGGVGWGAEAAEAVAMPPLSVDVDLESIPTPDLELSPQDVSRLFADRQVTEDVVTSLTARARRQRTRSGLSDQRVPDRNSFSSTGSYMTQSEFGSELAVEPFPNYDDMETVLPLKGPSGRVKVESTSEGACGSGVSSPSSSHVGHDHVYGGGWSASEGNPSPGAEDVLLAGRGEGEEEPRSRLEKLMPAMEFEESEDFNEGALSDASGWRSSSSRSGVRKKTPGRQSKDEELARQNGLPFSAEEIAFMSLQQFQSVLKSPSLTSSQKDVLQKIRRRGKNKLAARNCRQRRTATLDQLETEKSLLEQEKRVELQRFAELKREIAREKAAVRRLEDEQSQIPPFPTPPSDDPGSQR